MPDFHLNLSQRRRDLALVAITIVLVLSVLLVGTASPASARKQPRTTATTATATVCAAPATTAAKLRIRVQSTSPDAKIHLRPGTLTGRKDVALSGGATTGYVPDGVRVLVPAGAEGRVDTDVVLLDPAQSASITLAVEKLPAGKVTVSVRTATGTMGEVKLTVGANATTGQVSVPRSRLFDPAWQLPKADDRQLVLAAYYPWWTATGWETLPVAEIPLQPRSVWSAFGVHSMTEQARQAGVDGFVVSWMGETKTGSAYGLAADAANATNGVVAPYLEVSEALSRGGVATVGQWLSEALDRTGPGSLLVGDVPVVFVWDMAKLGKADWTSILAGLGRPVHLVGDADTNTHGQVMRGWHSYLPPADLTGQATRTAMLSGWFRGQAALEGLTPKLHVATVSPGFDDRILRGLTRPVVERDGGRRYDATWDVAVAGDPDMVLITSWNEWYEGSEIEPGTRWGDAALLATARRSAAWKACGT